MGRLGSGGVLLGSILCLDRRIAFLGFLLLGIRWCHGLRL